MPVDMVEFVNAVICCYVGAVALGCLHAEPPVNDWRAIHDYVSRPSGFKVLSMRTTAKHKAK